VLTTCNNYGSIAVDRIKEVETMNSMELLKRLDNGEKLVLVTKKVKIRTGPFAGQYKEDWWFAIGKDKVNYNTIRGLKKTGRMPKYEHRII